MNLTFHANVHENEEVDVTLQQNTETNEKDSKVYLSRHQFKHLYPYLKRRDFAFYLYCVQKEEKLNAPISVEVVKDRIQFIKELWIADQMSDWNKFYILSHQNHMFSREEVIELFAYAKIAGDCGINSDSLDGHWPSLRQGTKWSLSAIQTQHTLSGFNEKALSHSQRVFLKKFVVGWEYWNVLSLRADYLSWLQQFFIDLHDKFFSIARMHVDVWAMCNGRSKVDKLLEKKLFKDILKHINLRMEVFDAMKADSDLDRFHKHYVEVIDDEMIALTVKKSGVIKQLKDADLAMQCYITKTKLLTINKRILYLSHLSDELRDKMEEFRLQAKSTLAEKDYIVSWNKFVEKTRDWVAFRLK